uniref:DUF6824 domain-containing protein n=2 Tax=Pseudo-nitzschia australis TaxID=44445 RepID=A0A7S4AC90_9STRA
MRVTLYVILKLVKYDVDAQRSGVVLIWWIHEIRINDFNLWSQVFKKAIQPMPMRINALHYHMPASANQQLVTIGKAAFLSAIGSEYRARVRIHIGSATEYLSYLQTFGIQPSQVPIDTNTEERNTVNHKKWIEQQCMRENSTKEFTGIEYPRHSDVLFGRGCIVRQHPGNALYKHLLKQYTYKYNNATNRGSKAIVAWSIVSELQESHGSRFLREDKRSGFWYEVSKVAAREKVSVALRDMRKVTKNSNSTRAVQPANFFVTTSSKQKCNEAEVNAISSHTRSDLNDSSNSSSYVFVDIEGDLQQGCFGTGTAIDGSESM